MITCEIKKEYRNLKKGQIFTFDKPLTFICGSNGSGKTNLLTLIKSHWKSMFKNAISRESNYTEYIDISGLEKFDIKLDFHPHLDSARGLGMCDMSMFIAMGGLTVGSSGESNQRNIAKVLTVLQKNPNVKKLILFDEVELGLDIHSQKQIGKLLFSLAKKTNSMFIVVTHSLSILLENLANNDEISCFNMDTLTTMTVSEFIDKHY